MKMFSKPVLLAILILIVTHLIIDLSFPSGEFEFTRANYFVGLISNAILFALTVCLVKLVRTEPGYRLLELGSQLELGIWGYLWRSVIIYLVSLFFTAIALTYFKLPIAVPSIQYTLTFFVADIFVLMIFSWLIFSKDRLGQMKVLLPVLRGW